MKTTQGRRGEKVPPPGGSVGIGDQHLSLRDRYAAFEPGLQAVCRDLPNTMPVSKAPPPQACVISRLNYGGKCVQGL